MRMNNLGLGPFCISHRSTLPIAGGNSLNLRRGHAIKTLPVGLALERHQAAVCFLLIGLAVDEDDACFGHVLTISPYCVIRLRPELVAPRLRWLGPCTG